MLHAKNVPGRFWAESMKMAAHVINRLTRSKLEFVSPFEKLWGCKPAVSYFRVFGCVCYVFVPSHLRSKFDKKAVRCIFVGYDNQRKGWKCCDPTTRKCYSSRNVVFDEASSWWSSKKEEIPESKEMEDTLQKAGEQIAEIRSVLEAAKNSVMKKRLKRSLYDNIHGRPEYIIEQLILPRKRQVKKHGDQADFEGLIVSGTPTLRL